MGRVSKKGLLLSNYYQNGNLKSSLRRRRNVVESTFQVVFRSSHDQHHVGFTTSLCIHTLSLASNKTSDQGRRNVYRNGEYTLVTPTSCFLNQGCPRSSERPLSTTFTLNMAPRWSHLLDTRCRSHTGPSVKVCRETRAFRVLDHQVPLRPQSPATHTCVPM